MEGFTEIIRSEIIQIPKGSAMQQLPPTLGWGLRAHSLKSHQPGAPLSESQLLPASVTSSVKWACWVVRILSRLDNGHRGQAHKMFHRALSACLGLS